MTPDERERAAAVEAMMIDEAALHALVKDHMGFVTASLATPKDDWVPMLEVLARESPDAPVERLINALMIDFNEHDEKHAAMRRIGRSIYEAKKVPIAVMLSSECWIAVQRARHCEPRHDPARREAIQISALSLGMKHAAVTCAPIERDAKENIKLGEWRPLMKPEGLPLLYSFFLGFFEETAKKAGIKLPGDD